jgi:hypothetical protein
MDIREMGCECMKYIDLNQSHAGLGIIDVKPFGSLLAS